jgi:nucleoside-diphosphate-sugar epimerase
MRVFVAGGAGAIGQRLVPLLVAGGHEVAAMTRSRAKAHQIFRQQAEPVVCNVFDEEALGPALDAFAPEVVINQLTSIPPRVTPRRLPQEMTATNLLRTEGTARLLRAAKHAGARRFISQSVAFAYDPGVGTPASESDPLYMNAPPAFAELIHAVAAGERVVREARDIEGVVLRYGFLYGPGTAYARDGRFAVDVGRCRVPIIAEGHGCYSFVHVEDAAAATAAAVGRGSSGVYNVVDDEPAEAREWLPYYADLLDAPRPLRVPELLGRLGAGSYGVHLMTRMPGACNDRARAMLDWTPRFTSWRTGFEHTLMAA